VSHHYVDSFGFQEAPDFYCGKNSPDISARTESTDKLKPVLARLAAQSEKPEFDMTAPSHGMGKER
jgi:hypothetical protein